MDIQVAPRVRYWLKCQCIGPAAPPRPLPQILGRDPGSTRLLILQRLSSQP